MATPLTIALDIERLVADARRSREPLDLSACADDLFLRFVAAGCSRGQIAAVLAEEATAAGVAIR